MGLEQFAKDINLYIMCSSKGGVGKTTVATSFVLSRFLMNGTDTRMILFDFNIHNSDLFETFQYLKCKKNYTAIPLLSDIFLIAIHNINDKIFLIKPLGYVLEEYNFKTQHNSKIKKGGIKDENYVTKENIDEKVKELEKTYDRSQIIRIQVKNGERIYVSSNVVEHMSTYLMLSLFYYSLKYLEKKYTPEKIKECVKNILIDTDYHIKYFLDFSNSESIFNSFMNSILLEYQKNKQILYKTLKKDEIKNHASVYKKFLDGVNFDQKIDAFLKLEDDKETFLKMVNFTFINIFDISATVNVETLKEIVKKYSHFQKENYGIIYILNFYSNLHKRVNRSISSEIQTLLKSEINMKKQNKKGSKTSNQILDAYSPEQFDSLLKDFSKLLKEESIKTQRDFISKVILDLLYQNIFDGQELKYSNFWFLPYLESLENIIAVIKNLSLASKISINELMEHIRNNTGLNDIIIILNMFLKRYEDQLKLNAVATTKESKQSTEEEVIEGDDIVDEESADDNDNEIEEDDSEKDDEGDNGISEDLDD